MNKLQLVLVVLCLTTVYSHQFAKDTKVQILNDDIFEGLTEIVDNTSKPSKNWFIMLYAPWCGHCKRLIPTWEELPNLAQNSYNVAAIDCDQNPKTKAKFQIRGFPTLIFASTDGKYYKYKGPREQAALNEFAQGGYVQEETIELSNDIPSGDLLSVLDQIGPIPLAIGATLIVVLVSVCLMSGNGEDKSPKKSLKKVEGHTPSEKKRL